MWKKSTTIEIFGIAARDLAPPVNLLVKPSILTQGEVMESFLATANLFE